MDGGWRSGRRWSPLQAARRIEGQYVTSLRKVARYIGDIVRAFDPGSLEGMARAEEALQRYSDTLDPWANAVASRMLAETNRSNLRGWQSLSRQIGVALRQEVEGGPAGQVMRARLADQVGLIKSLPTEAAERVHKLTLEGMFQGTRAGEIAKEIARTGEVSASRAEMIARTEVSRAATELTAARAQRVGSTHFIWRTSGDSDVRASHRKLNGKAFRWDDPPVCDAPDHRALPGAIWNCRCFPEPVLPED